MDKRTYETAREIVLFLHLKMFDIFRDAFIYSNLCYVLIGYPAILNIATPVNTPTNELSPVFTPAVLSPGFTVSTGLLVPPSTAGLLGFTSNPANAFVKADTATKEIKLHYKN